MILEVLMILGLPFRSERLMAALPPNDDARRQLFGRRFRHRDRKFRLGSDVSEEMRKKHNALAGLAASK